MSLMESFDINVVTLTGPLVYNKANRTPVTEFIKDAGGRRKAMRKLA